MSIKVTIQTGLEGRECCTVSQSTYTSRSKIHICVIIQSSSTINCLLLFRNTCRNQKENSVVSKLWCVPLTNMNCTMNYLFLFQRDGSPALQADISKKSDILLKNLTKCQIFCNVSDFSPKRRQNHRWKELPDQKLPPASPKQYYHVIFYARTSTGWSPSPTAPFYEKI